MGDCCLPSLITNPIYIFCLWAHQLVFASIYAYPYVHMYWYTSLLHILDHCRFFSCCCYICTIAAMVPDHTYVCFAYRSDYLLLSIALPLPLLLPRTMFGPCFIYIYICLYLHSGYYHGWFRHISIYMHIWMIPYFALSCVRIWSLSISVISPYLCLWALLFHGYI